MSKLLVALSGLLIATGIYINAGLAPALTFSGCFLLGAVAIAYAIKESGRDNYL